MAERVFYKISLQVTSTRFARVAVIGKARTAASRDTGAVAQTRRASVHHRLPLQWPMVLLPPMQSFLTMDYNAGPSSAGAAGCDILRLRSAWQIARWAYRNLYKPVSEWGDSFEMANAPGTRCRSDFSSSSDVIYARPAPVFKSNGWFARIMPAVSRCRSTAHLRFGPSSRFDSRCIAWHCCCCQCRSCCPL